MWNDTELQRDVEDEIRWEFSAALTQVFVTVKDGAVELAGHVYTFSKVECGAGWRGGQSGCSTFVF